MQALKRKSWAQSVIATGVQTTSTNGTPDTGYAGIDNLILQLVVSAASGTTPTLNLVVQDSIDGATWNTIATFTQATTTTNEVKRVAGPFGNAIRAVSTIAGTTPSFTFTLTAQAEAKGAN